MENDSDRKKYLEKWQNWLPTATPHTFQQKTETKLRQSKQKKWATTFTAQEN